jgi:molecular chaperone GrpE
MDQEDQSQNEIHVETHTESHVSAGSSNDDQTTDDQSDRIDELTADLQRLQAEFVNYKRRAEAERADVIDFAKNRIVREFLTVRDSFDQELIHRPAGTDAKWAASIDAIRAQFDKVLSGLGVERFESKGQPFDPHLHEAIAMEDGEGTQEIVIEELQPGYKLGDTVLRPAMVKVGRTNGQPQDPAQ